MPFSLCSVDFHSNIEQKPAKEPEALQQPPDKYCVLAVVSFVSGGSIVALGNVDRKSQNENIKVVFTIKYRSTGSPYLGFWIKLMRHPKTLHLYKKTKQQVFLKYHDRDFTCKHCKATLEAKQSFLSIILNNSVCIEAINNNKLYIARFFKKNHGVEVMGYGSLFDGANTDVENV